MQKLLVTGGLGFIGSNFILMMLKEQPGVRVVNLDKMTYAGNPLNLAEIQSDARYTWVKGDTADEAIVEQVLSAGGFDCIVNFVAESHVDRSIVSAAPFVHSNFVGTQVLLDAALKHQVPRFVQISTDEVYGSLGREGAFSESSPIAPNNPYSATKAAADMLCRAYFKTHGFPVMITRCSNNYGPRQFPEKLIPLMISKAMLDESLPVYGDGLQIRDWIHVDDHCRAIMAVMQSGEAGQVYNIGGNHELTNLELVRLLLDKLGKPHSLIKHVTDRPGHDRRYAIDSGKLQRELGWHPQVEFVDGIAQTITWYKENSAWLAAVADGSYQK